MHVETNKNLKLRTLRYIQKFTLISLTFLIPLIVATYFMVQAQNILINKEELELKGNQFQHLVRFLWENIPKHKILANHYLKGNKNLKDEILKLQPQIDYDFKNLENLDSELETSLSTTASEFETRNMPHIKPSALEGKWANLQKQLFDLNDNESDRLHTELINDLEILNSYIGDISNLFHDSETEALAPNAMNSLPQTQKIIYEILAILEEVEQKKSEITPEQTANLTFLLMQFQNLTKRNLEQIQRTDLDTLPLYYDPALLSNLNEMLHKYIERNNEFETLVGNFLLHPAKEHNDLIAILSSGSKSIAAGFLLWDNASELMHEVLSKRIEQSKAKQHMIILFCFVTVLLGFIYGFIFVKNLSVPLSNLVNAAQKLTNGELGTRIKIVNHDEVGQVSQAFNLMAQFFEELIAKLQKTEIQLATTTLEIAASAKEQESNIMDQEASTKQIEATAKQISLSAKGFAETMSQVSITAEQTAELAASGKAGLTKMETIMQQMVDASANIAYKLGVLNEKAANITSIVSTINKVAEQTNLLSLNAAIEAEKAGEYGRSFSVIAREIRRLADQTANATLDIEKMINEIVSAVTAGVMGVDKFSEEIHAGVNQISTVGEQLTKIMEQVQNQNNSFEDVNKGMQIQYLDAEQINYSISRLSHAAQQTTEAIRHFHGTIDQLNKAGKEMQSIVFQNKNIEELPVS